MSESDQQGSPTGAATPAFPPAPSTLPAPEGWVRPWTPGLLTPEELEQYWRDGFVVKRDVFTSQELRPVMDAIDRQAALLALHPASCPGSGGQLGGPCSLSCSLVFRSARLPRYGVACARCAMLPLHSCSSLCSSPVPAIGMPPALRPPQDGG